MHLNTEWLGELPEKRDPRGPFGPVSDEYGGGARGRRAQKRVLTPETGSAHVLCPCSYRGTSQECVRATLYSVRHMLGFVSAVVKRDFSVNLRLARSSLFWKLPTKWRGCNAPSKNNATFPKTLQVPAMTRIWEVPPYRRHMKRVLSPFLLSKRVFEHVFHAPHPHIRQKQDRTGLWAIFSLGARRAILSSDTTKGTPQIQYEHTSTANSSPQPEPC